MRDHLATLLDDFRRYGREVAVVRYQGNRRRVTTYGELAQAGGPFCGAAGTARHRPGRPRAAVGREQRGVDRGLPWMHAARRAGRSAGCDRDGGVCRARGGRCEAETGCGRCGAAGAVARTMCPQLAALKTGPALCPPKKLARLPASPPTLRWKFCSPPAPPAIPKELC